MSPEAKFIGYTCAYTPLPLVHAAGFTPHRILPAGTWPDRAGGLLHDNICPHVKRIIDRAMANDLPPLSGIVFVNSCDAMRRAVDAWRHIRPEDKTFLLDIPVSINDNAIEFFARQLEQLAETLVKWGGKNITSQLLEDSIKTYAKLSEKLAAVASASATGKLEGGFARVQEFFNLAMTKDPDEISKELENISFAEHTNNNKVSLFTFGNILTESQYFEMIESCGARIIHADFCTATRLFHPDSFRIDKESSTTRDAIKKLAQNLITRPPCPRTILSANPEKGYPELLVKQAKELNATAAIGHVIKFCDPYLVRVPAIREEFKKAGIPLLVLEGDCTLGSFGQQKTRIEAFIEML